MSSFDVKIRKIAVYPHPNADALELAQVDGYRCVVKKDEFKTDDLALYIPEQAIIPDHLLQWWGFWKDGKGMLKGSNGNRVGPIKLRGELSQGIVIKVIQNDPDNLYITILSDDGCGTTLNIHDLDADYAQPLGIKKWEPEIPTQMAGEVYNADLNRVVLFDVENIKKYPNIFQDGEEVVFTEKLHGTFCCVGLMPIHDSELEGPENGRFVVFSKGLGFRGLCFKDNEANRDNVYIRALRSQQIFSKMLTTIQNVGVPLFILGEVYGPGIQKGFVYDGHLNFRAFAAVEGYRGFQFYKNHDDFIQLMKKIGIDTVPILYRGPYSKEVVDTYTTGDETLSGKNTHMREGIVITPTTERWNQDIGRVMLKSVSEQYLLRKGGTEYN